MALREIQRRYSTFIVNAFTYCRNSSRIGVPRNPIQESVSCNSTISQTISRISALQKRFYFKNREYDEGYWFHNPKRVRSTLFFFSCGVVIAVSSGKWVTVPYSGRSHFVLFHKFLAKILPDELVTYEGKTVLPPLHTDSLTALRIFQDIIDQASRIQMETIPFLIEITFTAWDHDYRKKQDEEKGIESGKFQIIVVDSPRVAAAASGSSGKIYVTSAMLRHYRSHEAMIATIFGHEVGHTLARHNEEKISKLVSVISGIGMSLYLFCKSAYIRSKMPYFDKFMRLRFLPSFSFVVTVALLSYLPMMMYSREIEMEADYIGLMMASSAGYNPFVGLLFPIYGVRRRKFTLPECFYPVPPGDKRTEILAHPRIINEAIYRHRHGARPLADD